MRVFLDTNVLVSAFAARGLCADLFELVLFEHDLILGRNVLRELAKALRQKLKLPSRDADGIIDFVSGEATQLVEDSRTISESVDPDDAIILGEALAGDAEAFVTGDALVLKLGAVERMRIVSPRTFWELLQTGQFRT